MDAQLTAYQNMMATNSVWQTEVDASPFNMPDIYQETIVDLEAFESIHPYPRQIIRPSNWTYDFHLGNCKDSFSVMVMIDLIRPVIDESELHAQHRDVCSVFRKMFQELSQTSYQSEAQLAQLQIEMLLPPDFSPAEEFAIADVEGNQYVNWFGEFNIISKTS